jgi:hypothetical protein
MKNANGSWSANDVFSLLHLNRETFEKTKPAHLSAEVWETLLVLEYLKVRVTTALCSVNAGAKAFEDPSKQTWSLAADKATRWLGAELGREAGSEQFDQEAALALQTVQSFALRSCDNGHMCTRQRGLPAEYRARCRQMTL